MKKPQSEKMPLKSMDVAEEKRDELKRCLGQSFPEAFAEGAIDFDQLKRVLGDWVEPGKERFGLNWPGKAECLKIIQQPSIGTLKPVRDESLNFDETENLFIEGDNLEVLKLLQKSYFGKIKMIYIDPPYNTGKEFIYPDKYAESLETYLAYTGQIDAEGRKFSTNTEASGRHHSRWLNMMYPRLYLAKNLLSDDGAIFISIDDNEQANLKLLCDQVFGIENFLGCISVVSNLKGRSDDKYYATAHNYLLAYSRGAFESCGIPLPEEYLENYSNTDEQGRKYRLQGLRKRGSGAKRQDRPNMYFPIYVDPRTSKVSLANDTDHSVEVLPHLSDGTDGRWRWGKDTVEDRLHELIGVSVGPEKRWDISQIDYADNENGSKRIRPKTVWTGSEFSNEAGTLEVKKLFGSNVFDNPKPIGLIKYCLEHVVQGDDIVLDFFAGSCSTAHAVYEYNHQYKSNAKFIMVQLPESITKDNDAYDLGFRTISDLAIERIRRASQKIVEREDGRLDLDGIGNIDFGFKVFKLSHSNFDVWEGDIEQIKNLEEQLSMHVDHIADDSSAEEILYELLLKVGFHLTTKVEKREMAGKDVFAIQGGALLICLAKDITPELIDALAEAEPLQVVCLDEGFKGNDQLKANAVQTFKARAQAEESEIVFKTV